jgi:hypothetical protein
MENNFYQAPQYNVVQNSNIQIRKLILTETGDYKDQWLRPMTLNVDFDRLGRIEDVIVREQQLKTYNVKPSEIAKAAPDILLPSATVAGHVDIPYGWREKRLRFVLEAVHPAPGGHGEMVTVLQGYTEYFGISKQSKSIDPRMKFYINSVLLLHRQVDHTGRLIARVIKHMDVVHLPNGSMEVTDTTNQFTLNTPNLIVCRPEDVVTAIGVNYNMDNYGVDITPAGVLASPVDVRKDLNAPAKHIATTLSGILRSRMTTEFTYNDVDIYDQAASYVKSPNRLDSAFLDRLTMVKGMNIDNTFTIEDLRKIDPNVDNVTTAYVGSDVAIQQNQPMFTTDTEELNTTTLENRLAILIAESLSGLLAENLLTMVHMTVTNITPEPTANILFSASLVDGLDPVIWAERLKTQFLEIIWPTVSANNQMLVNLDVFANLVSDTFVTISVNGNPEVMFRIPTFASATFTPLMMNKQTFETVTSGYKQLTDIATI